MRMKLLDYLRCPRCGDSLNQSHPITRDDISLIGELSCPSGHTYAIVNAIPRMLPDGDYNELNKQTWDSFTAKWGMIPSYGRDDKSKEFRLNWLRQRYGWNDSQGLAEFLSCKQFILDAGTGLGVYLDTFSHSTEGEVFAIDASSCVDLAHRYVGDLANVYLVQGDLARLPFKKGMFDFILCDQVLHHTPNTEASFKSLVPFLCKGGEIAIYVYKKKSTTREHCDDMIRKYTTQMTVNDCVKFSRAATEFGKAVSELNLDLQREIYWDIFKCFWNPDMDYDVNMMTNFDWYHPIYAWRHTPNEVEGWFRDEGLEVVYEDVSESGISVRGVRV